MLRAALLAFACAVACVPVVAQDEEAEAAYKRDQMAGALLKRGEADFIFRRFARAAQSFEQALALYEQKNGVDALANVPLMSSLATVYQALGRYRDAEPLLKRALAILEGRRGPAALNYGEVLNSLGSLYVAQARYGEAESSYQRAIVAEENVPGERPSMVQKLNNLAEAYRYQGRFAEAEPLYTRAIEIGERLRNPRHPDVASALHNLAVAYTSQGRYAEAEPLLKRALGIRQERLGEQEDYAATLESLANLYRAQDRTQEAEPLYLRAIAINEKLRGPETLGVAQPLNNLATMYVARHRFQEAEPLHRRALAIREKILGAEHPAVAESLAAVATMRLRMGDAKQAEALHLRAIAINEKMLGRQHPRVAANLESLAEVYAAEKLPDKALASLRRAASILERRFTVARDQSQGALAEQRSMAHILETHVALLVRQGGGAAESFRVGQLARASDTAAQVARMAARFGASGPLAQLARQRQDLVAKVQGIEAHLVREVAKPTETRDDELELKLRESQAAAVEELARLDRRLDAELPQYRELASPAPLEAKAVQDLLRPGEALVSFLVTDKETFIWALQRDSGQFTGTVVRAKDLEEVVKRLRAQLDLGAADQEALFTRPFDAAAAHWLYRALLAPVAKNLDGVSHLIVVPDGPLQSVPFAALLTEAATRPLPALAALTGPSRNLSVARTAPAPAAVPASYAVYADLPWLVKKHAVTVLPSVSSLRALRAFAKSSPGTETFAGFGNPVLGGDPAQARNASIAKLFSRGAVADVTEVRKLAPLPDTADELRAIAATLGARADQLYLGPAATESKLKELDLSRFRVLAFATHGLLAGEIRGVAEPALVLTPPATGSEKDDGLLTASEIAALKLNADWVVLSACNTAAPDGTPGAEGLSGLAKSFFYAGARSLLVSHWAVSSEAAVALTTRTFRETAGGANKAEALRRSMLAVMQDEKRPYLSHPALWAPFIVVGEAESR